MSSEILCCPFCIPKRKDIQFTMIENRQKQEISDIGEITPAMVGIFTEAFCQNVSE